MTTMMNNTSVDATPTELSDDTLDAIAAGHTYQTTTDIKRLMQAGYLTEDPSTTGAPWEDVAAKVEEAWARAGVKCVSKPNGSNEYYMNGRRLKNVYAYSWLENHHA